MPSDNGIKKGLTGTGGMFVDGSFHVKSITSWPNPFQF